MLLIIDKNGEQIKLNDHMTVKYYICSIKYHIKLNSWYVSEYHTSALRKYIYANMSCTIDVVSDEVCQDKSFVKYMKSLTQVLPEFISMKSEFKGIHGRVRRNMMGKRSVR